MRIRSIILATAAIYVLAACGSHTASNGVLPVAHSDAIRGGSSIADTTISTVRACGTPAPGQAQCLAVLRTDTAAAVSANTAVVHGYGPQTIASAYALPKTHSSDQTIAVVDGYNDPSAESDLAVYRAHFGLPPCTAANGCFRQTGQDGRTLPHDNPAWSEEISLDLDMVSATCPTCHVLLVEANDASLHNLGIAEDEAVALGATIVSNSYSGGQTTEWNPHYNHPGVIITAASGDDGSTGILPVQPCSLHYVVCVGATYLVRDTSARGWKELVWAGSGASCPTTPYIPYPAPKPPWQTDSGCAYRSTADVSAVGDPATPVAVYNSVPFLGKSGWLQFGGTSVSAPIIAGVYALAGNAHSLVGAKSLWQHLGTADLNDVTLGNNGVGNCFAAWSYICNAGPGYDGGSGVGTPNGLAAF